MKSVIAVFNLLMLLSFGEISQGPDRWVVYYNDEAPVEAFNLYDPIVLDSDHHPYLDGFVQREKTILGYLSIGEVEKERSYFSEVEKEGILLDENKYWPGSYFVDLRDPRWAKRVLEELIPGILMQRFSGIFLDTLDNAGHLETMNPEKYGGMVDAAVNLIKAIRKHYPQIKIMMNRGYELLPSVADLIDMELGESVYADYDFDSKTYRKVDSDLYLKQVKILMEAKKASPKLTIYTLDYWKPEDAAGIKEIYQEQRRNGFIPYVSTIDLHTIIPES